MSRFRRIQAAGLVLMTAVCLSACASEPEPDAAEEPVVTESIKQMESYQAFEAFYPDKAVSCIAQGDVSGDGIEDMILIYAKTADEMNAVAAVSDSGKWNLTEPIKAPYENQRIQLKNIDDKGPAEMIISGSRNGSFGMAIFRLEDGKLVDLFKEGMEDCC